MNASVKHTCGICVEEFPEEEVVKHCDGKHIFCRGCFDNWIEKLCGEEGEFEEIESGWYGGYSEQYSHLDDPNIKNIHNLIYRRLICPLCREKIFAVDSRCPEEVIDHPDGYTGTIVKYHRTGIVGVDGKGPGGIVPDPDAIGENRRIKKFEASYLNGKKHGKYTMWSFSGKPRVICHFKEGRLEGTYTTYLYDHGRKSYEVEYRDGQMNGSCRGWYFSGALKFEGSYVNHFRQGPLFEFYDQTGDDRVPPQKMRETNYLNGKLHGPERTWYKDGRLTYEAHYKWDLHDGDAISYFENGKIYRIETFVDGNYVREQKWYANGNLWYENNYGLSHMMDGLHQAWYENGSPQQKCTYKNGDKDGLYQLWAENGILVKECTYKNNMMEGLCQKWSPESGELIHKGIYHEGTLAVIVLKEREIPVTPELLERISKGDKKFYYSEDGKHILFSEEGEEEEKDWS